MPINSYFRGKSGRFFWINIFAMGAVLIAVPTIIFHVLGVYTHHGEKIEVPSVTGMTQEHAEARLGNQQLRCIIADSTYNSSLRPGVVMDQTPKAGSMVKSGRIVYLTINCGDRMIELPNLIDNSSLRTAEAQLKALGFQLTPTERVDGENKDWVVGIRQGARNLHTGELISRTRALTIVVQSGPCDSVEVDSDFIDNPYLDGTEI